MCWAVNDICKMPKTSHVGLGATVRKLLAFGVFDKTKWTNLESDGVGMPLIAADASTPASNQRSGFGYYIRIVTGQKGSE
jgi:hypothetical protein